jgi:hypothetical protein
VDLIGLTQDRDKWKALVNSSGMCVCVRMRSPSYFYFFPGIIGRKK